LSQRGQTTCTLLDGSGPAGQDPGLLRPRLRALVPLGHVDAQDDDAHPRLVRSTRSTTPRRPVLASQHEDGIAFQSSLHSTSGAATRSS
jgi:hypothetical protein